MRPAAVQPSATCWGLDLGGSKLAAVVLAAPGGRVIARSILGQAEWPVGAGDLRGVLTTAARELRVRHGLPSSIGLAVAAAVDEGGTVGASPNLAAPGGGILGDWLAEASGGCAPVLMNDGNAFLHGELSAADGPPPDCAVGVVLGTGVGGAVAFAGSVRVGPAGLAGEWGHTPPPRETEAAALERSCGCGRRGCIDALLGGPGWLWTARRHGLAAESPEAAVAALRQGDPAALAAAGEYRGRLARALALWTDFLDPDVVLLGGGLAAVPELVGDLGGLVAACRYGAGAAPRIAIGRLGRRAAAIGAALAGAGAARA